jgi:hypothetical protein
VFLFCHVTPVQMSSRAPCLAPQAKRSEGEEKPVSRGSQIHNPCGADTHCLALILDKLIDLSHFKATFDSFGFR